MKRLLFLLFALLLIGCKQTKYITLKNDTIIKERVIPVQLPKDSSLLVALFECNERNEVILKELSEEKTKRLKSDITVDNGKLTYRAKTLIDTVYIPVKDTIIKNEVALPVVEKSNTKIFFILFLVFVGVVEVIIIRLIFKK